MSNYYLDILQNPGNTLALVPGTSPSIEFSGVGITIPGDIYFKSGRPWFDIIAFGADPTGITDSTTAIKNAMNAVPTGGGTVFVPPGTYLISAILPAKSNTVIQGEGTIFAANGSNLSIMIEVGNSSVVTGITLDGNGSNQPSASGAHGSVEVNASSSNILISGVTIQNSAGCAIRANTATNVMVQNCIIRNVGLWGLSNSGYGFTLNGTNSHLRVLGNYITNCGTGSTGVGLGFGNGTTDVVVSQNQIVGFSAFGIALGTAGTKAIISDNYIDGSQGSGCTNGCIDIGTWTEVEIANNLLVGPGTANTGGGIANGPPSTNVIVTGNRVIAAHTYGISIGGNNGVNYGPSRFVISNNHVTLSGGAGIFVSYQIGAVVSGNHCSDNGQNYSGSVFSGYRSGITLYGDTNGACQNVVVAGNTLTDDQGSPTQLYGIYFRNNGGSAHTNLKVEGNLCNGNVTAQIGGDTVSTTLGAGCAVRDNLGFNPLGNLSGTYIVAPTLPASGSASTGIASDAVMRITCGAGVSVSAVAIGATTITGLTVAASTTSSEITVNAGQTITLTYAGGTPTWQWFGD